MVSRVGGGPEPALLPVPEPDLTPRELIRRAQSFRQLLRDQQEDAERLGNYTPMYLGRLGGFYHTGLVAPQVGAARAARDEHDAIAPWAAQVTLGLPFENPMAPRPGPAGAD